MNMLRKKMVKCSDCMNYENFESCFPQNVVHNPDSQIFCAKFQKIRDNSFLSFLQSFPRWGRRIINAVIRFRKFEELGWDEDFIAAAINTLEDTFGLFLFAAFLNIFISAGFVLWIIAPLVFMRVAYWAWRLNKL